MSGASIKIVANVVDGGSEERLCIVPMDISWKVSHLKAAIQVQSGIPAAEQRLRSGGQKLTNDQKVSELLATETNEAGPVVEVILVRMLCLEDQDELASPLQMFSLASRGELCVLLLGLVGCMGMGVAFPIQMWVSSKLYDSVADPNSNAFESVRPSCVQMAYFGAMQFCCAAFQSACFKIFAESQVAKWRVLYFDAVLHRDIAWFDGQEVGALQSQIGDDMEQVLEAFGTKLANCLMAVSAFVGSYIVAFVMGWQLALVMLGSIPLFLVGATLSIRTFDAMQKEVQGWYGKAAVVVEECLYAIRTVVSFGGEHGEIAKYTNAVVQARWGGIMNGFQSGAAVGFHMSINYLNYSLGAYYGATLRYDGAVNPATGEVWNGGTIVGVVMALMVGGNMLGQIDPGLQAFHSGRRAAGRFFKVLKGKGVKIQCRGLDERQNIETIQSMELKEVHFRYPARPEVKVLNGINLSIQCGEKVAFVGESGSGKSTIMGLLERFYDPTAGCILVNGVDLTSVSVISLRRRIGYVGQEPVLFATSIRENIMQGRPDATPEQLEKACQDAQLNFLDDIPDGLDTYVGPGGSQFSGGQKQRIAIARALIKEANFLFLDEATSALDNKSEKMIQATIDHISRKQSSGLGIVSIAHRLSTVRYCNVIYCLSHGTVVEQGTHDTLMARKGVYYALAASQNLFEGEAEIDAVQEQSIVNVDDSKNLDLESPAGTRSLALPTSKGPTTAAEFGAEEIVKEQERTQQIVKTYKVPMVRLLSYCRPEWPWFIPATLCALADGATMPVMGLVMMRSIGAFYSSLDEMRTEINQLSLVFLIIGFATFLCQAVQSGSFAVLGESMTQRLRVALIKNYFRQEIGFHDDPENTPGKLGKALELYTFRVNTFVKGVGARAGAFGSIAVGFALAFYYSWEMSLFMLGVTPMQVVAFGIAIAFLMSSARQENALLKQAQQIISDSLQSARTVHSLGNERGLVDMYEKVIQESVKGGLSANIKGGVALAFAMGIESFQMAGAFAFGAYLISIGRLTFVSAFTGLIGIQYALMGAMRAGSLAGDATKATVACYDMFSLLDRVTHINGMEPTGATPTKLDAGRLEFEAVEFHYPFRPQVQVLKGMSFVVTPGQSVGLVGPSGGGKSTVMALLQRFYDPMNGRLLVGEERMDLAEINIRWWRRQVGFVGQEPILFDTTVRNNVLYGLEDSEEVSQEHLEHCRRMANLDFLDNAGGWDLDVGPKGSRLSGGQKQRVAICRALVRNPALLLLDEATSALDNKSEQLVQAALQEALKGRTSFAIAHRLSTIAGCDLILVVGEGIILEKGTHRELMELQGVYYKLQMSAK